MVDSTISIDKIVKKRLDKFREKNGVKTYSDAINLLLERISRFEEFDIIKNLINHNTELITKHIKEFEKNNIK